MQAKTPSEISETISLIKEVLNEDFQVIRTKTIRYVEDLEKGGGLVSADLNAASRAIKLEHKGVGIVDAYFRGLIAELSDDYPSLCSIELLHFGVENSGANPKASRKHQGADAEADVRVVLSNSYGDRFIFISRSSSITRASVEAVNQSISFFLNSELATIQASKALEYYRREGRHELVTKYTMMLATLVRNTSYSSVLEGLRHS